MANEIVFENFIINQPSPAFIGLVPEKIVGSLDTLAPFNAEQINYAASSAGYYTTNIYANKEIPSSPYTSVEKPAHFYFAKVTADQIANALSTTGSSGYLIRILSEMAYGYYIKVEFMSDHRNESNPYVSLRFSRGFLDYRNPSAPIETRIGNQTNATMFTANGACVYLGGAWSVFGTFEPNNTTHEGLVIDLCACVIDASSVTRVLPEVPEDTGLKANGQWRRYNTSIAYWNALLPEGVTYNSPTYFETIINEYKFWQDGYGTFARYEISPQAGEPSGEDGYYGGSFDESSDPILKPTIPSVGVTNVGMVNVYRVPDGGLRRFGLELFPELNYTPPTFTGLSGIDKVAEFCESVADKLDTMFSTATANTLINYVIDCHVIPVTPTYTTSEYVKVGDRTMTTVAANPVTQDYVDFTCGELNIREFYANFVDYLTNAKLYLPFVGFVPIRAEWFQNSHLLVDYRFNVIDGSFVAFVRGYGDKVNANNNQATMLAQYTGNACVHIPVTGANYAQMVSGIIGAAGGIATGAATGNFIGAAGSALSLIGLHGDIAQSNAYSSSPAFMGIRVPFLLIERPVSNFSKRYAHEHGIPSNITDVIGNCTGFLTATDIHLDGITCTDEERRLIESALAKGVIV